MATKEKRGGKKTQPRLAEKKWGPFAGGTGVAVWLNEFATEAGTRYARTITLSPRRFRDPKSDDRGQRLQEMDRFRPVAPSERNPGSDQRRLWH